MASAIRQSEYPENPLSELVDISRRYESRGDAVIENLANLAQSAGNDWPTKRHVLE
jgi:hypothetical protein